jgi:DNA repair exonuclease SbcCD ATPase subunit
MVIKSIKVENYRIHRNTSVEFDPHLTVIGGPNESGKSTLAEALHRALFLKSRVTGEAQKSMKSSGGAGHPAVTLCFEAGGEEVRVVKQFRGGSGTTTLQAGSGKVLHDEEAETRLAELLGISEEPGKASLDKLRRQWAHLWVWQGRAGDDPMEHATAQKDSLVQRLQQAGGAAVMQSDLDARVAARFQKLEAELFTIKGEPKAGSDLAKEKEVHEGAVAELLEAVETSSRLQHAVDEFSSSTESLRLADDALRALEVEQKAMEERAARIAALRAEEGEKAGELKAASEKRERLEKADQQIRELRRGVDKLTGELDPREKSLKAAAKELEGSWRRAQDAEAAYRKASEQLREERQRYDLAVAFGTLLDLKNHHAALDRKRRMVSELQKRAGDLKAAMAKLPAVTDAKLKQLQECEGRCGRAAAALDAMAAGIEVLASTMDVRVGGEVLRPGQDRVLAEETEVAVGDNARFLIRPGGGKSLVEARRALQEATKELQERLDQLGLGSVVEGAQASAKRQRLESDLQVAMAEIKAHGAAKLDEEFALVETGAIAAQAAVEQLVAKVPGIEAPMDLASARALRDELKLSLARSEQHEAEAKANREALSDAWSKAEQALQKMRAGLEQEKSHLGQLQGQWTLLVNEHGQDEPRSARLEEARGVESKSRVIWEETRKQLEALQPGLLVGDQERVARSSKQLGDRRTEALQKIAVARNLLLSEGKSDPQARLAQARANEIFARDRMESMSRKARAIQLLSEEFVAERQKLADQFTQPLAEKATGYLQCLFGFGARASVGWDGEGFSELRLSRPGPEGALEFSQLSGGAREQVAAALRLAMAEVLAVDHGGSLPVVFDDAFAYADPERVKTLQRMLDLGASRGLQIIVLSCNPADYATLGARQADLGVTRPA